MNRPWFKSYEPLVPRTIQYPEITLDSFLVESARKYPYNAATNFVLSYLAGKHFTVGGKLTYRKLNELVDRFATALDRLGVRKGDRVALMLPNSPHFVIAFFGAMKIGAIVVNNNPTYTARELQHQLQDSGAETIVLLNTFWPRLRAIQHATAVKRVIVAHIFDTLTFPSKLLIQTKLRKTEDWVDVPHAPDIFFFQQLLDIYNPTPPKVDISPDDIALLQYTGGTTGTPKGAMLTHRNLVANTLQGASWMTKCRPGEEKVMAALPFFHVYGLNINLLYAVYKGAEMVIVPNPRPIDNVMQIIAHERCTIFPGVPAMYIAIVNHPNVSSYDLRSVKFCVSGAAALPMEVQENFGRLTGGRLVEAYGLTETSPGTHANPIYGTRKSGSIGIPFPDTDAKIIDLETGAELPIGGEQAGELCIRGPQVMKGYWNKPEATAEQLDADGWLHTGDICKTDADGYFFIVDRKKDMINASGFKVLPRDVEEVLFQHPKVLEAAVVGVPNPKRGDDTVIAFLVLKPGAQATAAEIRGFCEQHLASFKIPREIEFRDELPKTIVGKVLRRVLIQEEQQKQAGQSSAVSNS